MSRQGAIEAGLVKGYTHDRDTIFYDLTLSYIEGEHHPLGCFRYLHDKNSVNR
jgi:hypothetical protein